MPNPKEHLKKMLKHYRKEAGLSLDQTAKKTGVSKAMLGQIERGESSPTAATLWKIATGLKVSLSSFLEPVPDTKTGVIIRSSDEMRRQPTSDGMLIAPLFPYEERLGFEFYELTFLPGYERIADPHEPGVFEQVSLIEGKMEILADGHWHSLVKGQSIRFPADKAHGYRNSNDTNAVIHDLIYYPHR